jgi:hypothetical protein
MFETRLTPGYWQLAIPPSARLKPLGIAATAAKGIC